MSDKHDKLRHPCLGTNDKRYRWEHWTARMNVFVQDPDINQKKWPGNSQGNLRIS